MAKRLANEPMEIGMSAMIVCPRIAIVVAGLAGLWVTAACASTPAPADPTDEQTTGAAAVDPPEAECNCPCPTESASAEKVEYVTVGPRQSLRKRIVRDRD